MGYLLSSPRPLGLSVQIYHNKEYTNLNPLARYQKPVKKWLLRKLASLLVMSRRSEPMSFLRKTNKFKKKNTTALNDVTDKITVIQ